MTRENKYGNLIWASSLGIMLVAATAVGLFMGIWLDKFFGTKPWFTMIFFFLGVVSGFWQLAKELKKRYEKDSN